MKIHCQCEHVKHIEEKPEHWDNVLATSKAKLLYGTFFLCEDCDTNYYDNGDRTAPSEPIKETV